MARNENFGAQIAKVYRRTKSLDKTVAELNLDPDLVLYWLKREGVDMAGQKPKITGQEHITLGASIVMLRLEKGIGTTGELAEAAGMSSRKMGDIERGERDIPFSELMRVARAIGVPVSVVLERVG